MDWFGGCHFMRDKTADVTEVTVDIFGKTKRNQTLSGDHRHSWQNQF